MSKKPILKYKGVEIFDSLWDGIPSRYIYSLLPYPTANGDNFDFDIRRIPSKYRSGLSIEIKDRVVVPDDDGMITENNPFIKALDEEKQAHLHAIRRAIDNDYDFFSATQGSYTWLQRVIWGRHRPRSHLNCN
ncbi:hypothetical protein IY145_19950 [Methylosinus sp. H3A]|uniref:hypothetical protein n=1 Tax=Methylosinus sp. H3A TaxID=2785786 RepID=UPI0018C1E10E|nr:hypothetical protein [Methylosinus sp. H3A]MBG0811628.1 hypothetical protein [Methylosinus sp. H3A]